LRQWLIEEIQKIDESRRIIKDRINKAEKDENDRLIHDGDVKAKSKGRYLAMERSILRDKLGQVNRQIKERNISMHSLKKNQVQIFIEMAKLLEENYPEIYDKISDMAEVNLNIRERRSTSGYVQIFKDNNQLAGGE
jgi:hypothetical protein